jgi:hypothetical protein
VAGHFSNRPLDPLANGMDQQLLDMKVEVPTYLPT